MSNDFSQTAGPDKTFSDDQRRGMNNLLAQLNSSLRYLENLAVPDADIPEVQTVFDDIMVNVANIRAIHDQMLTSLEKPKWKPWMIGGRVKINGGVYAGQVGTLLGMVEHPAGQMGQVRLDNDKDDDFVVEVGPTWLEGL